METKASEFVYTVPEFFEDQKKVKKGEKPGVVKVPSGMKGTVVLKRLRNTERLDVLEQVGIKLTDSGELELSGARYISVEMTKLALSRAVKVEITMSDGRVLETADDLDYEPSAARVITDIATKYLQGVVIGKN